MPRAFTTFFFIILATTASLQNTYFPPLDGDEWESISPESLDWCEEEIEQLLDFLDETHTKSFILLKDGRIVFEHYFDTFTQDSLWYWASAGKTINAFLIGLVQQDQLLSIDDAVSDYLGPGWTSCTPEQEALITIRHQLSMSSGLDDGVPDPFCTHDTCLVYLADAGSRWAYHNGPYTLIGQVLESATSLSLNQLVNQRLRNPTGITGFFLQIGYNRIYMSNSRSMARFGLLIQNEGNWDGNQIMTDQVYFDQMINTSQEMNLSYGYLWWLNGKSSFMLPQTQFVFDGPLLPDAPDNLHAALGANGQLINVVPDEGLVLIRMGNEPTEGEIGAVYNNEIWKRLNKVICSPASLTSLSDVAGKIFPNPAKGITTISFPGMNFHFKVYDGQGKLVLEKFNCFDHQIISNLNFVPGLYLVHITLSDGNAGVFKLIMQDN